MAVNQDFGDDADFARIEARKARVSPLLTGFTVEGLSLWPKGGDGPALSVESVSGRRLRPAAVLKALLGKAEPLYVLAGEGQVTARGARFVPSGSLDRLPEASFGTLYVSGFRPPSPEDPGTGGFSLKSLRVADLRVRNGGAETGLDTFTLENFAGWVAGSVTVTGFTFDSGAGAAAALAGLSAGGLDLNRLLAPGGALSGGSRPLSFLAALFESMESLELEHLTAETAGSELFYVPKATLSSRAGPDGAPVKSLNVQGARAALVSGAWDVRDTPQGRLLVAALGEAPEGSFTLTQEGGPPGSLTGIALNAAVENSLDVDFTQKGARLPALSVVIQGAYPAVMALLASELGEGGFAVSDRGAAGRLYPVISRDLLNGAPPEEALLEAAREAMGSLSRERILNIPALEAEVEAFLGNPGRLALAWNPAPGFPSSVIQEYGLLDGSGPRAGEGADGAAYGFLEALRLSVSANGRPAVAVRSAP
jgi:hypothetical protein